MLGWCDGSVGKVLVVRLDKLSSISDPKVGGETDTLNLSWDLDMHTKPCAYMCTYIINKGSKKDSRV